MIYYTELRLIHHQNSVLFEENQSQNHEIAFLKEVCSIGRYQKDDVIAPVHDITTKKNSVRKLIKFKQSPADQIYIVFLLY